MSRVDEFDSFYRSAFAEAVEVTYALCGDRQVALEATTDAFRRAWRDWAKIRDRDPLGHVRTEAWRATALSRSTHPLRRRHEDDSDIALLDALGDLHVDERRLIVLMTLGRHRSGGRLPGGRDTGRGRHRAGHERAGGAGEDARADDRRDRAPHAGARQRHVDPARSPTRPASARAARRGRRRNTVLLVAAAVLGVIGSGVVVTDDDALAMQTALPDREKIGAESTDIVLDARKIDTDDLLSARQVSRLNPQDTWKLENTDDDPPTPRRTPRVPPRDSPIPIRCACSCAPSPETSATNERVVQSIEVSSSEKRAKRAARAMIRTFADCEHPRVQLVSAHTVERPFGNFTILRLASHRSPRRTLTVGFSQSGSATSTVVHEVDGKVGPDLDDFARTLNDSVSKVCKDSGGKCTDDVTLTRAEPPRTTEAPAFLGVVDLPPIADVDRVWAAAPAEPDPNPAATMCDRADFGGKKIDSAHSRVFVLYQASELPKEFGLTETVGRFEDEDSRQEVRRQGQAAHRVMSRRQPRRQDRPDRHDQERRHDRVRLARRPRGVRRATARTTASAIVRRGADVAQVTFTPAGEFDMSKKVVQGRQHAGWDPPPVRRPRAVGRRHRTTKPPTRSRRGLRAERVQGGGS